MSTIPTSGFYSDVINGFFGDLSTAGKNTLWNNFLTSNNLTTTPPEDPATEQKFVTFIRESLGNVSASKLSPEEIMNRELLSAVFDAIIKLLQTLHDSAVTGVELQSFYSKAQNEYTKMMARIPWAIGGASGINIIPANQVTTSNLSDLTLGYNNVSIQDIIDCTLQLPASGQQFINFPTLGQGNFYTFVPPSFVTDVEVNFLMTEGLLTDPPTGPVYIVESWAGNRIKAFSIVPIVNGDVGAAAQQAFINVYQNPASTLNNNYTIAWPNNSSSNDDINTRAAKNQTLSQFVTVDRSKQQVYRDSASSAQNVLDATNTAISGQSSIINKSLQMLSSMLNSIYKN